MPNQHLNPSGMHTPTGYSHVVKAGDTIYIAGQVAVASDGSVVGKDDPAAQAEQVYKNIQNAPASDWGLSGRTGMVYTTLASESPISIVSTKDFKKAFCSIIEDCSRNPLAPR